MILITILLVTSGKFLTPLGRFLKNIEAIANAVVWTSNVRVKARVSFHHEDFWGEEVCVVTNKEVEVWVLGPLEHKLVVWQVVLL